MSTVTSMPQEKARAFTLCGLAYAAALCAALGTGYALQHLHPILTILYADIAATLVIYLFGRLFGNASFYDPYWSLAPVVISLYWIFGTASGSAVTVRQVIVAVLIIGWGGRLTFNWARQWQGLKHEDWRYRDLRKKSGKWFWLVDLVGIELMPTFIVFLGCLSLYPALFTGNNPFGILDVFAIFVAAGAIAIEAISDEQLRNFVLSRPQAGSIMTGGLWAYSRHPNYLGEVLFWWGLFFFALAAAPGYWWMVIGPAMITSLFVTISIPLMEKRSLQRRPGYAEIKKQIPALFPRLLRTGRLKSDV